MAYEHDRNGTNFHDYADYERSSSGAAWVFIIALIVALAAAVYFMSQPGSEGVPATGTETMQPVDGNALAPAELAPATDPALIPGEADAMAPVPAE